MRSVLDETEKPLDEAVRRVYDVSEEPLRAAFMVRALNAFARLAGSVDPWVLGDVASQSSDYAVLFHALKQPEVLAALREDDPLAEARLAGLRSRELLLQAEGGAVNVEKAAALLGISRQAVDRRRKAGKLIALTMGRRGYRYPIWQFTHNGALPGLGAVLARLGVYGPWMQTAWFVNPNTRLEGATPLTELRDGHVERVVDAAAMYGEQGS